jgi:CheY-like chemotaxis protein
MKTKKVLIVDDDIDVIIALETILKKEGVTVISANDKIAGKELALQEKPDLAILDVMMSTHFEGFELAKDIVENDELKNTKVLMQTSIDILTTTKGLVQDMAREYRKSSEWKDLDVILVKNITDKSAGIDYKAEDGKTVFFHVDGFIKKPVNADNLIPEMKRILGV